MKNSKIFFLIFIILILFNCHKNTNIVENKEISWNNIYENLQMPYKYSIYIKKPFAEIKYEGEKDGIGNIVLKGYFKLEGEETENYDLFYDRYNWYNRETKKQIEDAPLSPAEIIENMIKENQFDYIKNNEYMFNANIAFIDPINYLIQGIAKIENNKLLEINVDTNNIKIKIKLQYKNNIIIPYEKDYIDSVNITINSKQKDIINKRLLISHLGYFDNKIKLYRKYDYINTLIYSDSARIGAYSYTEPFSNNNDLKFYNDVRNTCKIIEPIYCFTGKENIFIIKKGNKYNIRVKDFNADKNEKLCLYIGNICFYSEFLGNDLIIKNIPNDFIDFVYAIMKYPYIK